MLELSRADFADPALATFLQAHLDDIEPTAPPASRHALDLHALQSPAVRLWAGHIEDRLVATGGLAALGGRREEIKCMRTDPTLRGTGIGSGMLRHLLQDARSRDVRRVSLETGSMDFFATARALYAKHGFTPCLPFGGYLDDPNSVYLSLELETNESVRLGGTPWSRPPDIVDDAFASHLRPRSTSPRSGEIWSRFGRFDGFSTPLPAWPLLTAPAQAGLVVGLAATRLGLCELPAMAPQVLRTC